MNNGWQIKRGEIYWVDSQVVNPGSSVEGKRRPCLVISNDKGNAAASTVIIAGISTTPPKEGFPCHVAIGEESGTLPGRVMLEQIRTVDKASLDRYLGTASLEVMAAVDKALSTSVGLGQVMQQETTIPVPVKIEDHRWTEEELHRFVEKLGVKLYVGVYKRMRAILENI